jgi:hypothetical protein
MTARSPTRVIASVAVLVISATVTSAAHAQSAQNHMQWTDWYDSATEFVWFGGGPTASISFERVEITGTREVRVDIGIEGPRNVVPDIVLPGVTVIGKRIVNPNLGSLYLFATATNLEHQNRKVEVCAAQVAADLTACNAAATTNCNMQSAAAGATAAEACAMVPHPGIKVACAIAGGLAVVWQNAQCTSQGNAACSARSAAATFACDSLAPTPARSPAGSGSQAPKAPGKSRAMEP